MRMKRRCETCQNWTRLTFDLHDMNYGFGRCALYKDEVWGYPDGGDWPTFIGIKSDSGLETWYLNCCMDGWCGNENCS